MKIFVASPWNTIRRKYCEENDIGLLYAPAYNHPIESKNYILDNGAYRAYIRNEPWDETAFYGLIGKAMKHPNVPYFTVIPDIVAGGMDSFTFSLRHIGKIPEHFPKYLAVQDGLYPSAIEDIVPLIDGVFVGGTTTWKWRTAENWINSAHDMGLKCHIGRVSTFRNFLRANYLGADSVDGSTLTRHNRLHKVVEWREELEKYRHLAEGVA